MTLPLDPSVALVFLLMFARLGTMMMLMPGFGERSLPMRFRLMAALLVTVALLPLQQGNYTVDTSNAALMVMMLFIELAIGFTLGLAIRLSLSCLNLAGNVIAQSIGLGFAMQYDPTQGQQGAVVGNFLSLLGLTLIFAADLHHGAIGALSNSFAVLKPGVLPPVGDAAKFMLMAAEQAFRVGVQLSAPFLVFGLVFNAGLGILSKMMPQMQVFFVGMPLSILAGYIILLAVIGVIMNVYLGNVEALFIALATGRP